MAHDSIIYIVDDDGDVRRSLGAMLSSDGYVTELHESGVAFLEQYQPERPGCILMDIVMPDMSGLQALDKISALPVASPVIIMTGQADVPMAICALESGAFSFVEKPFRRESLIQRVESAIEHDRRNRAKYQRNLELEARLKTLTPRESEVLNLVVDGKLTKQIAKQLGISKRTVETHRGNIMTKLQLDHLAELVSMAIENRLFRQQVDEKTGLNFRGKRPWRADASDYEHPPLAKATDPKSQPVSTKPNRMNVDSMDFKATGTSMSNGTIKNAPMKNDSTFDEGASPGRRKPHLRDPSTRSDVHGDPQNDEQV